MPTLHPFLECPECRGACELTGSPTSGDPFTCTSCRLGFTAEDLGVPGGDWLEAL